MTSKAAIRGRRSIGPIGLIAAIRSAAAFSHQGRTVTDKDGPKPTFDLLHQSLHIGIANMAFVFELLSLDFL